jgi:(E)-4-hydroxy-3-methylbut-2-enyl-diphosphate synthase
MPLTIFRKKTRRITVGGIAVGGGAPISVQSMTNTKTDDVTATVGQIRRLEQAGCEIVRVAVPDRSAADAIPRIKKQIDMPLVADVHFDHRLAIASARGGADGLRFNPGNIGTEGTSRHWSIAPGITRFPFASASTPDPSKKISSMRTRG